MQKIKATLSEVKVGEECHSILETSFDFEHEESSDPEKNSTLNLVMIDASGSMSGYWKSIQDQWNEHISPLLEG